MDPTSGSLRLGPYEIDRGRCRLVRGRQEVALPRRTVAVLIALADARGAVASKEDLVAAGWSHSVSDDSLFKVISDLRREFAQHAAGILSIETHRRDGYRLDVAGGGPAVTPASDVRASLEPFLTLTSGRALLESFNADLIRDAAEAFTTVLHRYPRHPGAHIGLANARHLQFESTRARGEPAWDLLAQARQHAYAGCEGDPQSPHGWGVLASILSRSGEPIEAEAAARKAVSLGPADWRHQLRLAFVCGGTRRLAAALEVLKVVPHNPLAHWMVATVYVARELFTPALEHTDLACAQVDVQHAASHAGGSAAAAGLHLQRGLVLRALGHRAAAREALRRELALEDTRHVYTTEACANAWYTLAALHFEEGDMAGLHACFHEVLRRVPGHGPARAVLRALRGQGGAPGEPRAADGADGRERHGSPEAMSDPAQQALETAIYLSLSAGPVAAAQVMREALTTDTAFGPGSAWILPVEPFLNVAAHRGAWRATLAILHDLAAR